MLNYIEYLHTPTKIAVILVGVFLITQVIGELLEFKGKVVPEFLKIRKFFARKKRERKALSSITGLLDEYSQMSKTIVDTQNLLSEVNKHYSEDNITMRNDWIESVNKYIKYDEKKRGEQDKLMRELNEKLDKNNADTLSLLIDNKRNTIINFAQCVIDDKYLVTREQFERIFGNPAGGCALFSAPGRTELGGNHTDHQHGRVLCASVGADLLACAAPNGSDRIRICSEGFAPLEVSLGELAPKQAEYGKTSALV